MLYDNYEKKIRKVFLVLKQIYRLRFICIALMAIVFLMSFGYSLIKGMHYNVSVPNSFTYGESLKIESNTFFSDVEYQYRKQGKENWQNDNPVTAGNYQVRITTDRVFGRVNHQIIDFSIDSKTTTLTLDDSNIPFGGEPSVHGDLTKGDYIDHVEFSFDDLSANESSFNIESITIKNIDGENVTNSYTFNLSDDNVSFVPRPITFKLIDQNKVYSGNELNSNEAVATEGSLLEGHKVFVTSKGSQVDVGMSENKITDIIILDGETDVTENYYISFEPGILEVNKRSITIETKSDSSIYDGLSFTNESFEIIKGNIINEHTIEVKEASSITNFGTIDNDLVFKISDDDGNDVTDNYNLNIITGTLEIMPRPITIQTESATDEYDGSIFTHEGFEIIGGDLLFDHSINVSDAAGILNVGSADNILEFEILNGDRFEITNNYAITLEVGTLEITPQPVTIGLENRTAVYDGSEFTSNDVTIIKGSLTENHIASAKASGSLINVGTTDNTLEEVLILEGESDVTYNYDITFKHGTLEVTKRPVTILTGSFKGEYTGKPQTDESFEIIDGSLVDYHMINVIDSTNITELGKKDNMLYFDVINEEYNNKNNNYDISIETGILEVVPRTITVSLSNQSKIYNGTPLTSNKIEVKSGELLDSHNIIVDAEGSQTNVGNSENSIKEISILSQNKDVSHYYDITLISGELLVTERPLLIETASDEFVYNGFSFSNEDFQVKKGSLLSNHQLKVIDAQTIKDVGTKDNVLEFNIFNDDDENVFDNYRIIFEYGVLEVTPRLITIETHSKTIEYNGYGFALPSFELIEGSLVKNHSLYSVENTIIRDIGTKLNVLTFEILDGEDNDKTHNYEITLEKGILEMVPRSLTIKTASSSTVYDGEPYYDLSYKITEGSLADDHEIDILNFKRIIDAGTIANNISFEIRNIKSGDVVTENYDMTIITGELEVIPRPITIETGTSTKPYDGTPLINNHLEITKGSLLTSHSLENIEFESITDAGLKDNIPTFDILDKKGENKLKNYDITFENGILEIYKRHVTITLIDKSKPYDSTPLTSDETLITHGSLLEGHDLLIEASGSQTEVGMSDNNIIEATIFDGEQEVTNNYKMFFESGLLEVTSTSITIETANDRKPYDGMPLSNESFKIIDGNLSDGASINVINSTEIEKIGTKENILEFIILDKNGNDITDSYHIETKYGTLEITKRLISISTPSDEKPYDGAPLTAESWDLITGELLENHHLNVDVIGTITEVGKTFNTFNYEILDDEDKDVLHYYLVDEKTGVLEITFSKIEIVIQSSSASKNYDGTPLTNDEWNLLEGQILSEHELIIEVTGEITELGSAYNVFNYLIVDQKGENIADEHYDVQAIFGLLNIFDDSGNGTNQESSTPITPEGWFTDGYGRPMMRIKTEKNDLVYLRDRSYGDYNKSGFDSPNVYQSPYEISPLKFPSLAINGALESYELKFEALQPGLPYYLSYYATNGYYDNVNDVYLNHGYGAGYTLNYIPISDIDFKAFTLEGTEYESYELAYREFVYENYLNIPDDTKASLLSIANKNELNASSDYIIEDVQNYILKSANYNKQYTRIPDDADFALYFLEHSREGVCQQFAMAATVMYRSLGIPARYVTGFTNFSSADEWVEIGANHAHAWVEVYIEGFGWQIVEVTPGQSSGTGTIPLEDGISDWNNDCEGNIECEEKELITFYSANASKIFDGTPLSDDDYFYQGDLEEGYTVEVEMDNSITQVGEMRNTFSVVINNENNQDVTDQYRIRKKYGSLVVVPDNDKTLIEFQLYDISMIYADETVTHGEDEYWNPSKNLPDGYSVTFETEGELKEADYITTYIIPSTMRIYDDNKMDVTNQFNIVLYDGTIEVLKRNLTINTYNAEKYYDGEELLNNTFYISQGTLINGHAIDVQIIGSQTEIGISNNTIKEVIILNEEGNNVTNNYRIKKNYGLLVVLEE